MFVLNSPIHGYKLFKWILDVYAYFIGLVFPFLIKCFLEVLSCSLPILNISLHCYVWVKWTHVHHVLIINFVLYIALVSAGSTTNLPIHLFTLCRAFPTNNSIYIRVRHDKLDLPLDHVTDVFILLCFRLDVQEIMLIVRK